MCLLQGPNLSMVTSLQSVKLRISLADFSGSLTVSSNQTKVASLLLVDSQKSKVSLDHELALLIYVENVALS